ncbi:YbhB/YbcL family Raf kinase inhibitor-like protein [Leifsonia sp. 21MFCrub1.1]|uniref:YbhB/YbcL family Raf kinase inhibitor-like protein n=1 Tax=Leifsonia sp. 21MFCrub1.1 TaxID=1798223 RepID=UPI000892988C|nr:YbhB/YbcL family Raf kinase inhibitor-like protein [Leifsonia sp. 21MFCrub1.1]SEA35525.1 Raf kinase inhibitor-like protein, YbhB/YbcL family [Leifsonia sp. 21MFCrub1.1]
MDCLASTGSELEWVVPVVIAFALIVTGVVLLRVRAWRSRRAAAGGMMVLALVVGLGLTIQAPESSYAAGSSCSADPGGPAQDPGAPASGTTSTAAPTATPTTTPTPVPTPTEPPAAAFSIASADWSQATIPAQDACTSRFAPGSGRSPAVSWSDPPAGTVGYAVKIFDTDANFLHWEVLNLPAGTTSLAAGASGSITAPASELTNDFGRSGYGGPCPPPGSTHHYTLTVFALSRTVTGDADIAATTLGQAQLTSTYRQ